MRFIKSGNRVSQQKQQNTGLLYLSQAIQDAIYPVVVAKTADYTIPADEAKGNRRFTNDGATGAVVFELPPAVKDMEIHFLVAENYQLRANAQSGDTIYTITTENVSSIACALKGAMLRMYCINDSEWICDEVKSWIDPNTIGVFGGGAPGDFSVRYNTIDYVNIAVLASAVDFGDLTTQRSAPAACASSTRGIFAMGADGVSPVNTIDYILIASPGNAVDFGDLTVSRYAGAGCSNSTRGIFMAGYNGSYLQTIDYISIATLSNASGFGNIPTGRTGNGGCASQTRGISMTGESSSGFDSNMDYLTIATTSNASFFGNVTQANYAVCGFSNSVRGVWAGGSFNPRTWIEYITIATLGNSATFGTLSNARYEAAGCASPVRGLIGGGWNTSVALSSIEYITLASTGNGSNFGSLSVTRRFAAGLSNCHGGI